MKDRIKIKKESDILEKEKEIIPKSYNKRKDYVKATIDYRSSINSERNINFNPLFSYTLQNKINKKYNSNG